MIPLHEINGHTNSFQGTVLEKVSNETNCQKRKRVIQTCFWTAIWILVCIPSNILAMIFYLKQNNIVSHDIDGLLGVYNNSNTTHRIYDDEIPKIQLNYSTNVAEKVYRK